MDMLEMAGRAKLADITENAEIAKITDTVKIRARVEIMGIYGSDGNCESYGRYVH